MLLCKTCWREHLGLPEGTEPTDDGVFCTQYTDATTLVMMGKRPHIARFKFYRIDKNPFWEVKVRCPFCQTPVPGLVYLNHAPKGCMNIIAEKRIIERTG